MKNEAGRVNEVEARRAEAPLVLALDVGTSSCRALLYDAGGRRVAGIGEQLKYEPRMTADGGAEMDADELVERVVRAIDRTANDGRAIFDQVRAVAASVFWHSLLGVDERGR